MLLKLSGDNLIVSYFFTQWQEFLDRLRMDPVHFASLQISVENEDDLKIAIKIARLYCRQEKRLPLKGLKMIFQIYSSPVFAYAIALYPKEKIIKGMLTLVSVLEQKFSLHEEAKVSKDLLKHESNAALVNDAEVLFVNFTQSKAKRMRQEIFQILKRVQEIRVLDRKQISPYFGYNMQRLQQADLGGA
jgi:hypothetical protein